MPVILFVSLSSTLTLIFIKEDAWDEKKHRINSLASVNKPVQTYICLLVNTCLEKIFDSVRREQQPC